MVTALGIENHCPRRKCKSVFAGFLRICYSINNTKKNQNLFQNEKQWAGDCSVWSRMICGSHTLSFNEWLYFAQSKWKYKNSKQQIKGGGESKISSRVCSTQQRQLEQPNSDSKGDVIKWGPTNGITSNQLGTLSPQLDVYLPILIAVLLCPDKQQWPLSPAATVCPPAILKDVNF